MALKVQLKPNERIIIGDTVITNAGTRAHIVIDGNAPILREKDIIHVEQADTPCKRIYLALQTMYLSGENAETHSLYLKLVRDLAAAAPSLKSQIGRINNLLLTGFAYKALKEARNLIRIEKELMDHAAGNRSLREERKDNIVTTGS